MVQTGLSDVAQHNARGPLIVVTAASTRTAVGDRQRAGVSGKAEADIVHYALLGFGLNIGPDRNSLLSRDSAGTFRYRPRPTASVGGI